MVQSREHMTAETDTSGLVVCSNKKRHSAGELDFNWRQYPKKDASNEQDVSVLIQTSHRTSPSSQSTDTVSIYASPFYDLRRSFTSVCCWLNLKSASMHLTSERQDISTLCCLLFFQQLCFLLWKAHVFSLHFYLYTFRLVGHRKIFLTFMV